MRIDIQIDQFFWESSTFYLWKDDSLQHTNSVLNVEKM